MKLTTNNSALVLIDVQEKLLPVMAEKEALIEKLSMLIQGARIFGLPIYWMEQYPKLFDMLQTSGSPHFKPISRLVR